MELSSPLGYDDVLDNLGDGFKFESADEDCVVYVYDTEQPSTGFITT